MKKQKFAVWIAFPNYWGEMTDKAVIAVFFSKHRAEEYLLWCRNNEQDNVAYGIDEQ